jgi:23S rRNA (uracil1939-C5)-methyltransferase
VDVAIENARFNAKENNVSNAEFVLGDMKDTFNEAFLEKNGPPDCVITDPPRSGMHPDVVKQLSDLKLDRLVYVSCNPSTMARDLKLLKEVYDVESVQPVDMFPQTYHIEAVAKLTRKS